MASESKEEGTPEHINLKVKPKTKKGLNILTKGALISTKDFDYCKLIF
jgi:hypothetical protein